MFHDLRYAFRALAGNPGFTVVAVLCLALGIGVNGTIFSVVDGILLQPFPFPDAERLVVLNGTNPKQRINRSTVSFADLKDWREQTTAFSGLAAFQVRSLTIVDGGTEPERYRGAAVTFNLFALLGTPPALGRDFGPDDDRAGAEPVVLLSDDVWKRRYSADRGVIGRAVSINGRPHTVIGVMPEGFKFPETQQLWVPLAPYEEKSRRDARYQPDLRANEAGRDVATGARRSRECRLTSCSGLSR